MNRRERRSGLAWARATRGQWHPLELVPDAARQASARGLGDCLACYRNNVVSVQVYRCHQRSEERPFFHLAVRRHDGEEIAGWDLLQRAKAELFPGVFAIEIYPPEDQVVDAANMRHLFVCPGGFVDGLTIAGEWA